MQIEVNFQNKEIADKVLWILERLKNDGVEIIKIHDSEDEIKENFQEGLQEMKLVLDNKLKSRPVEELLNEL
ncbi:hypothetical protein QUF74_04025 [Candidatus Halobeggiatoa sp. HSG11]|nr:hypothetical protein [Candidatus Halobeggiatoa sp. HSG11]